MADCPDIITSRVTDKTDGSTSNRTYEETVADAQSTLCNVDNTDFYDKAVEAGVVGGGGGGGSDGVGQLVVESLTANGSLQVTLSDTPNNAITVFALNGGIQIETTDWTEAAGVITFTGGSGIINGTQVVVLYTKDGVAGGAPVEVTAGEIVSEELTLSGNSLLISLTPVDPTGVLVWYGGVKMDNALVVGGTGDYTVATKTITTIGTGVIPNGSTLTVVYQKA